MRLAAEPTLQRPAARSKTLEQLVRYCCEEQSCNGCCFAGLEKVNVVDLRMLLVGGERDFKT